MKLLKCFICGICIAILLSSCNLKTEESLKIESSTIDSLSEIATNDSVITSYSIHYTKLYENIIVCAARSSVMKRKYSD